MGLRRSDLLQLLWFGGLTLYVLFIIVLVGLGGRWRNRGSQRKPVAGRSHR